MTSWIYDIDCWPTVVSFEKENGDKVLNVRCAWYLPRVCRARRITRPVSFLPFELGLFACLNGKTRKICCAQPVQIQSYCCTFASNKMLFCWRFCKLCWIQISLLALSISAVDHATALSIMQQCHHSCVSAVDVMRQRRRSCNSAVVDVTALLTWCDSAVDHVTALSIMRQCRLWCDSTVDMMRQLCWRDATALAIVWQRCHSCDSAIIDVTALSTWCDSAVDHVTALSIMWQCRRWCDSTVDMMRQLCRRDATALAIVWQRCHSCDSANIDVRVLSTWWDSAVDDETALLMMRQCCQSCDSAVDHATVPLLMWQHCTRDATALSIMWQRCRSCDSAVVDVTALSTGCDSIVDVMRQCCQSCDSAIVDVTALLTWCDSVVEHVTVLSLMWRRCQHDATALSIICQLIVSAVRWSIVQSHAQQLCWAIVIQWTVSSLNCQLWCCNCVCWLPFVQAYKTGFDVLIFSLNLDDFKVHNHVDKYGYGQLKSKYPWNSLSQPVMERWFIITTSNGKMFLYFHPALYSQRELMPILIVFHFKHRHSNISSPKSQWVARFALLKKFSVIWFQIRFEFLDIFNLIFFINCKHSSRKVFWIGPKENFCKGFG